MSAPQPPVRTSRPVAVVCAVAAGLLAATVIVIGAVGVWEWATSPILPSPSVSHPLPASTAGPSPITPVELTECPINGCGPR